MARVDGTSLLDGVREALVDQPDFMREIVQVALNRFLEAEMTEHLRAGSYERSEARVGYRNGFRTRMLRTRVGTIELSVPMDRDGSFQTELFRRMERNEQALVLSLMEMYLEGVSTRKVRDVTEKLCGVSFSKSTVSRLVVELDADLAAWRDRPLTAAYPYLFVDARYEFVRSGSRVVSMGALVVVGVREDGRREILGARVAPTESEATYEELFRSLHARGLRGVRLVVSDDHAGLVKAIRKHFQGVEWQRCIVHYMRNALARVAKHQAEGLKQDLRMVFDAPTRAWAERVMVSVVERWAVTHPGLAGWLEESLGDCLTFLSFPESHRRRLRTTNVLERFNQELKRRTRVVRIFPNPESCLRLVSALCMEKSEEWVAGRVYLDMRLLEPLTSGEGVVAGSSAPPLVAGELQPAV
jgi:putative transposase